MAVVRIGVPVAPADRPIQLKAEVSDFHAGASTIGEPALSRIPVAPQPRRASATRKVAAALAEFGGAYRVDGTQQRKRARRGNDRQSGNHRFLPWHVSAPAVRT